MQRPAPESTPTAPRAVRAFAAAGALLATALLSGCGLVAGFVPPIEVGDPLGVEGKTVTATAQEGPLPTMDVSHIEWTTSTDIEDIDQNTRGFSLASFDVDAGFEPEVVLEGTVDATASDFPASFTVSRVHITATLEDDVNGSVRIDRPIELGLVFTRGECELGSCSYTFQGDAAFVATALAFGIDSRQDLRTLKDIILLDGTPTPNRGTIEVGVEFDSDPSLAGFTATFTLTSEGSEIEVGG